MTKRLPAVGQPFIPPLDRSAVEYNAGRAGMHQCSDPVPAAGLYHILRTRDIDGKVCFPASPDPRLGGNMKYRVVIRRRPFHKKPVPYVADQAMCPKGFRSRIAMPADYRCLYSFSRQPFNNCQADKTAAAGNKNLAHRSPPELSGKMFRSRAGQATPPSVCSLFYHRADPAHPNGPQPCSSS